MQGRSIVTLGVAMLAGAMGGALLGPAPVGAVAREIVELQQSVNQVLQSQQTIQTLVTQNEAVEKTLIEQSLDSVNKLSGTMGNLQKTVEDIQATSGARLDSMSTQVQGVSDNLQEVLARVGKLNQQLTDAQNAIQSIDAKLASTAPPAAVPAPGSAPGAPGDSANPANSPSAPGAALNVPTAPSGPGALPAAAGAPAAAPPPSSDLLYSNGLRDLNGHKYDLSLQEFQDYLKYYSNTDLASNAQFYLGEIFFAQEQYQKAVDAYGKVIDNFPRSFKLAPAHLKRGLALIQLGEKAMGIKELRTVIRMYPGTDEERRARAKLHDLGETA
jgi:tol-pal system protein YbgF